MGRKRKNPVVIDVQYADKALGQEKIEEIVEKEWKTAELPPAEEIVEEKHPSSMARNNVNSRKNLIQYRKDKPKEVKEKVVKALRFRSKRPDKDLNDFFEGLLTDDLIHILVPMRDALESQEEEEVFFGIIKHFVRDFPRGELTASDVDDISTIALNRILELRLLKVSKNKPQNILDAGSTIEKLRKNSDKLKMNLASRRMDRVDTKNKQSFSIVDIAVAYDTKRRAELEDRVKLLDKEEAAFASKKELPQSLNEPTRDNK